MFSPVFRHFYDSSEKDVPILCHMGQKFSVLYKYLAEKELDLTATLDAKEAYSDADFVVIAAPTNVYSTNRIDVA